MLLHRFFSNRWKVISLCKNRRAPRVLRLLHGEWFLYAGFFMQWSLREFVCRIGELNYPTVGSGEMIPPYVGEIIYPCSAVNYYVYYSRRIYLSLGELIIRHGDLSESLDWWISVNYDDKLMGIEAKWWENYSLYLCYIYLIN